MDPNDALSLADYRRTVAEMYATVRSSAPNQDTWRRWVEARDRLFRSHPQSAIADRDRPTFGGLPYFSYDPGYRFEAEIDPVDEAGVAIAHSAQGATNFVPLGTISLSSLGSQDTLTIYWLDSYGGGLFLPFRDGTAGSRTYGGGRYLLDGVKGADLGGGPSTIMVDFNYAYHPSCVYSDTWSCPLAPPANRTGLAIEAGERLAGA